MIVIPNFSTGKQKVKNCKVKNKVKKIFKEKKIGTVKSILNKTCIQSC